MKLHIPSLAFASIAVLALSPAGAFAQDSGHQVLVPAGTLLRCTMDEPNFSSKTADVGDPVLCSLTGMTVAGRSVFPRGSYLGGHLEAEKDPGHFVGKGYLQLEFDHLGLPDGQVNVLAKVIGAKGYQVDRHGDIEGKGHAVRDTFEWLFPPMWPEKIITLPLRGPRPTLKGEEQLTLRLMDDVSVPAQPIPGWHYFNGAYSEDGPSQAPSVQRTSYSGDGSTASTTKSIVVLRNGMSFLATSLRIDGNCLIYSTSNEQVGTLRLEEVDWTKTEQANADSGMTLALNR